MVSRSTMKPRILPSSLAQTTARWATGALVIQVLLPVRRKPPGHLLGARRHRAGIGAVVGLGQAETAEQLGGRHPGQVFAALRLAAVGVDRLHGERGLHRHGGAEAGIDPLQFARDQPVADVIEAGAAVFLRNGRAEQPERAHLALDRRVVALVAVGFDHTRQQLLLRIVARGVAHHALFFGQFAFEIEGIVPLERGVLDGGALRPCRFGLLRDLTHGGAPAVPVKLRSRNCGRQAAAVAGSAAFGYLQATATRLAPVAQLDRALPSEGRGQGFEILRARHFGVYRCQMPPIFPSGPSSCTRSRPSRFSGELRWQLNALSP